MLKFYRYWRLFLCLTFCGVSVVYSGSVRNVILCIGDGMGPEQVKAARYYAGTNLCFETFPFQSSMTTGSADSSVTDSAASGTAMATGQKVDNGIISRARPGDGSELLTALEYFQAQDKSVGLVTTTYMTHATPAAFGAHELSRSYTSNIADDYLTQTRPNVLLGGGANGMSQTSASDAGYVVVTDRAELLALDADSVSYVSGQFGSTHLPYQYDGLGGLPGLPEMTFMALDILDNDPDGFFLMVEGGRIDHAGHANLLAHNIFETLAFADAVEVVTDWAGDREDTLIIVTADHETGGLTVIEDNGSNQLPTVTWSVGDHTSTPVPVYARGLNADFAAAVADNTNIFEFLISSALVPERALSIQPTGDGIQTQWTASRGDVYRVEYTPALGSTNWTPLMTVTSSTSRLNISDFTSTTQRFYRLISLGDE